MEYVLIAEGEDSARETLAQVLGSEGYRVVAVPNGCEVIEALVHFGCPSLLLMNMEMPEMDGAHVAMTLKLNPRWGSIPVVYLSAQMGLESASAASEPLLEAVRQHAQTAITQGPLILH